MHIQKKVNIVIVTFNAMTWIKKCLASCDGYDVIIVDNASTDNTVATIKLDYPKIVLLKQTENYGFGKANNIGIQYSLTKGAEQILLLNQDAYILEDCLQKLLTFQKENPEFGVLSPIHLNGKQDGLDKNFASYMSYDKNPDFYSDYVLKQKLKPVYEVPFVNAAAWLLSKNLIDTVGGFDPLFFHYGEDENYCQRATYHGFKIGVIPDSFISHDRENRKSLAVEAYSDKYYSLLERSFKLKYANINNSGGLNELQGEISRIEKTLLKLKLKTKFSKVRAIKKHLELIRKVTPFIRESREFNILKGRTYM